MGLLGILAALTAPHLLARKIPTRERKMIDLFVRVEELI